MAFDDDDWGTPVAGGEFARVDALAGRLLVIFPIGYIEHSPTKFSQPGKPSDVVVCDVIDLDAADEGGNPGKIYRTMWIRPSKLIVGLRPLIGGKVLGRISKGMAQNGMNPPWEVKEANHEPGALDRVRAWAQLNPHFKVSPFQPPRALAPQAPSFGQPQQQYTPGAGYQGPARQQAEFPQSYPQHQQQYQQTVPQPQYPQTQPQQYPPQQQQPVYNQTPQPYQPQPQQYQQQPPPPPQQHYPGPQPQQYQQPQQPQQVPAYPVQGAPQQDQGMLEQMRLAKAERERVQEQQQDPWTNGAAPF